MLREKLFDDKRGSSVNVEIFRILQIFPTEHELQRQFP